MFECKNIYVLNKKDKEAIVYEDADGNIIRLTREVFSSENEFQRYKEWSDDDYHDAEKNRHVQSNRTLSLDGLSEEAASVDSAEQEYIAFHDAQEREALRRLLMDGFDTCLTTVQRRRLWLYYVSGLTVRQIADAENVSFQNIAKAISAATKKLKSFLKNRVTKPRFSGDR